MEVVPGELEEGTVKVIRTALVTMFTTAALIAARLGREVVGMIWNSLTESWKSDEQGRTGDAQVVIVPAPSI